MMTNTQNNITQLIGLNYVHNKKDNQYATPTNVNHHSHTFQTAMFIIDRKKTSVDRQQTQSHSTIQHSYLITFLNQCILICRYVTKTVFIMSK